MAEPIPLMLPPGLVKGRVSDASVKGRYTAANHMRWIVDGDRVVVAPMPGWALAFDPTTPLIGKARGAHAWLDNSELPFFMVGTYSNLYEHDGTTLSDITPSGFSAGSIHAGTWTMDNMGEVGISCFDLDGRIFEHQPGAGGLATVVTNSPAAKATFVTDEKFLFALAVDGDPRAYAWASQDERTVWTPTSLNSAGDLPINEVGLLMCGHKIKGGALIWTTTGVYFLEFLGRPDIYGADRAGNNCGIISRNAKCVFGSSAYWMGKKRFFQFKGYTKPLDCEIADYVFGNLNEDYAHKVWAHHRPSYNEVWFAYPHGDATECSHAAIYNYEKGFWNHTEFARLSGFDDEVFGYPVGFSSEGRVFNQESGYVYDEEVYLTTDSGDRLTDDAGTNYLAADPGEFAAPTTPYMQSGPTTIGEGDRRMQIDEFLPDEENQGDVTTTFVLREYANSTPFEVGPYSSADRVGVGSTARFASVKYELAAAADARVGNWLVKIGARRGRY